MSTIGVSCFRLYATYQPAAAPKPLPGHRRHAALLLFKPRASPRFSSVQSLPHNKFYHITLATNTKSKTSFCTANRVQAPNRYLHFAVSSCCPAQTLSPSSRSLPSAHISLQARPQNNPGSFLILRKGFGALSASSPSKNLRPRPTFHNTLKLRSFSTESATMATLSQPQTPSALNSPLREHRHRPVERLTDRLETPSLDDRSYRVVRLPNQLEVLLVHDAETDKASAAMDVNVGNFSDEADFPGLAHAVEHLLFMGTKKVWIGPALEISNSSYSILSIANDSPSTLWKTHTRNTYPPTPAARMRIQAQRRPITTSRWQQRELKMLILMSHLRCMVLWTASHNFSLILSSSPQLWTEN